MNPLHLLPLLFLTLTHAQERVGQTLDACSTDMDCLGNRKCITANPNNQGVSPCSGIQLCACFPEGSSGIPVPKPCIRDNNCESGETCAEFAFLGIGVQICVSKAALNPTGTGLTLDRCNANDDCQGGRQCINGEFKACTGNELCACTLVDAAGEPAPQKCVTSGDCQQGEGCIAAGDEQYCISKDIIGSRPTIEASSPTPEPASPSSSPQPPPASPSPEPQTPTKTPEPQVVGSATPEPQGPVVTPGPASSASPGPVTPTEGVDPVVESPSAEVSPDGSGDESGSGDGGSGDSEEAVCIDAEMLRHLSGDELVFETHRKARVLCDEMGSCATGGHMVAWEGRAMRMSSYCRVVGCVERVMMVNSPRYKRGVRVMSKTGGLEFTALAARWDTWAEEVVLRTVVHVGL